MNERPIKSSLGNIIGESVTVGILTGLFYFAGHKLFDPDTMLEQGAIAAASGLGAGYLVDRGARLLRKYRSNRREN